jgi:hypothetical protein
VSAASPYPDTGESLDAQSWDSNCHRVTVGTEDCVVLCRRLPDLGFTEARSPMTYNEDRLGILIPDVTEGSSFSLHFVIAWRSLPDPADCSTWFAVDIPHARLEAANQTTAVNAPVAPRFHADHHRRRVTESQRHLRMADSTPSKLAQKPDEPLFKPIPPTNLDFQSAYDRAAATVATFIEHIQRGDDSICSTKLRFRDPDESERLGEERFAFIWLTGVQYHADEPVFSGTFFEIPPEFRKWHEVG